MQSLSVGSPSSQLLQEMICPVMHESFQTVISLRPCAHKVDLKAHRLKNCPLCRVPVEYWSVDGRLTLLAKAILRDEIPRENQCKKPLTAYVVSLFCCPIDHTLLTEAKEFLPCAHKVNETAIQKWGCLKKCVVCSRPVNAITTDYKTRNIARILLEGNPFEIIRRSLLSYPGSPSVFYFPRMHVGTLERKQGALVRCIFLRAINEAGVCRSLEIFCSSKKEVVFRLGLDVSREAHFWKYLQYEGVGFYLSNGNKIFLKLEGFHRFVRILLENNLFPEFEKKFLQALLKKQTFPPFPWILCSEIPQAREGKSGQRHVTGNF